MRSAISVAVLVACATACGKSSTKPGPGGGGTAAATDAGSGKGSQAAADRWKPITPPPVSPTCAAARRFFGYVATCVEQPLPELTTAAGTVTRLWSTDDPTKAWVYALTPPSGAPIVAEAGPYDDQILRKITAQLDVPATPPDVLARLYAALLLQAAEVRCAGEPPPPGRSMSKKPCEAPKFATVGGKPVLQFAVEEYPHPTLLNRDHHRLYWYQVEVSPHELSSMEGEGLADLEPATPPLPTSAPPLPTMTAPPSWAGVAEPAPADLDAALCKAAADGLSGLAGHACKAYRYPALALPTGELFFLANDAGQAYVLASRAPDGTIRVGLDVETHSPLAALIPTYDPAVVAPATFLAAYLLLDGKPARILCLPGSGDALPDDPCTPPTAEKQGDDLMIKAIIEELPLPGRHSIDSDPAVRRIAWEFSPGGGMSGGGTRLVDLRAPTP
ncbi:MAG: hypothetical protein JNK64_03305 [Myxococcales bacterium]|nr:hypothetical protein [Myxococcales bacterium]